MRTISVVLCLVCIGCTAVSPPATMMLAPAPTPALAASTSPVPVERPQKFLLQALVNNDDEACSTGMGD
jgi:hypothetical protein